MPDFKFYLFSVKIWVITVASLFSGKLFGAEHLFVSQILGKAFVQPKRLDGKPPRSLKVGDKNFPNYPFALVTNKNSMMEITGDGNNKPNFAFRLGRSTAIELTSSNSIFFFQGTCLFSHLEFQRHGILSDKSHFEISGKGTWIAQCTEIGFKVIVLEGELQLLSQKKQRPIIAGELILITDQEGKISQSITIELPLLLQTSRIVNHFSKPLPSKSRLVSAAQVQALRMKKKYEAMIGGVSKDRKLRIWSLEPKLD